MSIFNIDYFKKVQEWLPPDKRGLTMVQWVWLLISEVSNLWSKGIDVYKNGFAYSQWVAGTYGKGARVKYKSSVWESLIDSNTDVPTSSNWKLYLPSFVGVDERQLFNGQKLVLEYALNRYYSTVFRQPNLVSDIYIDNLPPRFVGFIVGQTEGSLVSQTDTAGKSLWNQFTTYNANDIVKYNGRMYLSKINSNNDAPDIQASWFISDTINYDNIFQTVYNFNVNVPSALYYSTSPNIQFEMRQIIDPLINYSLTYTITPY